MRRLAAQSFLGVFALAAVLGWYYLAPASLGGSTSYVVTDGISMLPRFHGGDLVLVRAQSDYRVGEIVAYRSRMLNTIVLHRIVAEHGGHYTFKGDNNGYLDNEHPTRADLVGTLWLHLPGLGSRLAVLRAPRAIGLLIGTSVLLLLGGAFERKRRLRRRRRGEAHHVRDPVADWRAPVLTAGLVALAPFSLLTLAAFGRPAEGPLPVTAAYKQGGTFTYSAHATAGTAYPAGRVATGDPLFLKLVDAVDFGFDYRFDSTARHTVHGRGAFSATIASSTGWTRTLRLEAPVRFSGDALRLHGTLRLGDLAALQQQLENATGALGSYTLTVTPHVSVRGAVSGLPVQAAFSTPLSFSLDPHELQPLAPSTTPADGTTATAKSELTPSTAGAATGTRNGALSLSFGPVHASVSTVRRFAVLGLGATLLCLALGFPAGLARLRRRSGGEAEQIRARYAQLIVPIARLEEVQARRVVHVSDIDALARVAERYERMILHERRGNRDSFCVSDDGVLYRYVVDERAA